jgi:hypothetical protein
MDRGVRLLVARWVLTLSAVAGPALSDERTGSLRPQEFGISEEATYSLGPHDFQVHPDIANEAFFSDGYIVCDYGINFCSLAAPIHLPSGTRITSVQAFYYDNRPGSQDPEFSLYRFGLANPEVAQTLVAGGPTSSFDGGYTSFELPVAADGAVVDNGSYFYSFRARLRQHTSDSTEQHRLVGVAIRYVRQVSPAPPSATFDDVPSNHPYFRHIEALFDSGITAGCSAVPPMFCPDRAITRGEMAVFLAKALGLHWR